MYRDRVTTQVEMQFSNLFSEFLNLQIKSNYFKHCSYETKFVESYLTNKCSNVLPFVLALLKSYTYMQ